MKNLLLFWFSFLILFSLSTSVEGQDVSLSAGELILVLNVQDHFTRDIETASSSEEILARINRLTDVAGADHVIYVNSLLRVISIGGKGTQIDTVPGMDVDQRLHVVTQNIFQKASPDAFTSESFYSYLKEKEIHSIFIVGYLAEHSVLKTALSARKKGYTVSIFSSALAYKTPEEKAGALKKMEKKGVIILP